MSEFEQGALRKAAQDAWLWGLPLIEMAQQRAARISEGVRPGEYQHQRKLIDARESFVTTPNNDTLYSQAWVDLNRGPVKLTMPASGPRYFSLALMDMYTNNFSILGTRTTGGDGGVFTLVGPADANAEPARYDHRRRGCGFSREPWWNPKRILPQALVETDEIDRFTKAGLLLQSGKTLQADIIVTETGFHLSVLGDIAFTIDNKPLDFVETLTYRGMMFTSTPNMAWVFGHFRVSWTLRTDLVADFVCRLLPHMKERGATKL